MDVPDTPDQLRSASEILDSVNLLDETDITDAKTAAECGRAIMETICAFANTKGGHILCGAKRDTQQLFGPYAIVGVPDPDKLQCDILNTARDTFSRPISVRAYTEQLDGSNVVLLQIPKINPSPLPVHFKADGFPKGCFLRRGSSNHQCTNEDIPKLLEPSLSYSFEQDITGGVSRSDLDRIAIAAYRGKREQHDPDAAEMDLNEREFLQSRRCFQESSSPETALPNNLALLMFGKRDKIESLLPQARFEYFRVPGTDFFRDPGQHPGHYRIKVVNYAMAAIDKISAQIIDDLPKSPEYQSFRLDRNDSPLIQTRLIREVVVNAFVHRDYTESSPIVVTKYANRIMVSNPGSSLLPIELMGQAKNKYRNKSLGATLCAIRYGEGIGTGVGVLRSKMRDLGMAPPVFDSDNKGNFFTAYLVTTRLHEYNNLFEHVSRIGMSECEKLVVFFAREIQYLTVSMVQSIEFTAPEQTVDMMRGLVKKNLLQEKGRGSSRSYVPTEYLMHAFNYKWISTGVEGSEFCVDLMTSEEEQSRSDEHPAVSCDKQMELLELPHEILDVVQRLGPEVSDVALQCAILMLCLWRPLTAKEIGVYINRRAEQLRTSILDSMLESGQLIISKESGYSTGIVYEITEEGRNYMRKNAV